MIKFEELNPHKYELTEDQKTNLLILQKKMNVIREKWGSPMIVTSGVRSMELQKKIYLDKGFSEKDIPMGSAHLVGLACDISDKDGSLYTWCTENIPLLEELEIFLECKDATPGWVHFQNRSPNSGNRFFKPY